MKSDSSKKMRPGLLAGLISGGAVLIAATVFLVILFTRTASIIGPWHNESMNQQLLFHDDGTVVIQTKYGDYAAEYVVDSKTGKGVMSLNGKSIVFLFADDSILLTDEGSGSIFVRGVVEISAASSASGTTSGTLSISTSTVPSVSPVITSAAAATPTPAASAAASPSATTSAPVSTKTPSKAPTPTPTDAPETTSAAPETTTAAPETTSASLATIKPGLFIIGNDPVFSIVGTPVLGLWRSTYNSASTINFFDNNTYTQYLDSSPILEGTYTYDPISCKGSMDMAGYTYAFTVSGDTLNWDSGIGKPYIRE